LWFAASVCGIAASVRAVVGSATYGFAAERRYSRICSSPAGLAVR
jgi:hypothetical protein